MTKANEASRIFYKERLTKNSSIHNWAWHFQEGKSYWYFLDLCWCHAMYIKTFRICNRNYLKIFKGRSFGKKKKGEMNGFTIFCWHQIQPENRCILLTCSLWPCGKYTTWLPTAGKDIRGPAQACQSSESTHPFSPVKCSIVRESLRCKLSTGE